MEVAQITREHSIRSETSICGGFDKGIEQDVRNKNEVVNSVPPTDGWANRMNESEVGTVSEVFCRTQIERLARVVGIS